MEALSEHPSVTIKHTTGCGSLFTSFVVGKDGKLLTVFANLGKAGTCARVSVEMACRLITLGLENGADPHEIARQLRGMQCSNPGYEGSETILSCADGMGRALQEFLSG
jgi:ribonucleoside-diphosphate reductase alpha chain